MNTVRQLSTAAKTNASALAVAAAALLTMKLAGAPGIPTVPPGVVMLTAAAVIALFGARWRFAAVPALVIPVFLSVGGALADTTYQTLAHPDQPLFFTALTIQLVALAVAVVSGAMALLQSFRKPVAA